jgi:hypothetical protein
MADPRVDCQPIRVSQKIPFLSINHKTVRQIPDSVRHLRVGAPVALPGQTYRPFVERPALPLPVRTLEVLSPTREGLPLRAVPEPGFGPRLQSPVFVAPVLMAGRRTPIHLLRAVVPPVVRLLWAPFVRLSSLTVALVVLQPVLVFGSPVEALAVPLLALMAVQRALRAPAVRAVGMTVGERVWAVRWPLASTQPMAVQPLVWTVVRALGSTVGAQGLAVRRLTAALPVVGSTVWAPESAVRSVVPSLPPLLLALALKELQVLLVVERQ